ncbi:MAG: HAD-IB family hydrolase [Spirochaetae bacterium HGW-Spirochaetae-1]|jgi:HAD superfamily hydrolase (TIGR01490 family)|nr:MAG: HAD-IB family hydrolase [Spirochaetae bacterium HGW-Spirochaetae-1]
MTVRTVTVDYADDSVKTAFFDLDDTLTDIDTDWLWTRWRLLKGPGGWREFLFFLRITRLYKQGRLTVDRYMAYHLLRIKILNPFEYRSLAERFFLESGRHHIFARAAELVAWYKDHNIPVVLITAQNDILAEPFARLLGFHDMIANRFIEEGDVFTGVVTPYNFQEGKVHWAEKYLTEKGISFSDCAFYSDSIHDAPLLSRVAFPVAVNPDKRLTSLAHEKGWRAVNFKGEMFFG